MAFTPNKYLTDDSHVYLRDQQHAARLFVDDQFRLAPKHKFLFHVAFGINLAACGDSTLINRHRNEINMLVKSVSLPSFTITADTVNQYNRKKVIQTQHKPGEIAMTFHDDNMGLINQVWQNYYKYYYADPTSAQSGNAYTRNATRNFNYTTAPYGLDNGSTKPFFNYITIYQMARHEFISYKLINPMITSWDHGKMAYAEPGVNEFTMKLQCEAISYGSGSVTPGDPEGFALEHYDLTPSPLQGTPNITSASPTFSAITKNDPDILNTVLQQINTYQNTQTLTAAGTTGIVSNLAINTPPTVNGLQGIAFPISNATSPTTKATPVKLGI